MIDPHLGDPGWLLTYVDLADRILAGGHPPIADVSPVYLGLMIAFRFLGASIAAIRTVHLLMLFAATAFCALAAKRLAGPVAAVATAVLILGNRAAWIVSVELDPKALIFLLTSAALWCLLRRWHLEAGLLLGLAAATHPYGYVLLAIALLWSAATSSRRSAFGLLLGALIPILLVRLLAPVASHASTRFYEGNNPLATGCGAVTPRAVTELQVRRRDASPDVAYGIIAAGNRSFWRDKALAFVREYPATAIRRFTTKALLTVHHFDVHDVVNAQRRHIRLSRIPAIGFGLAFVLAVAALILAPNRRELLLPALFALALIVLLTLFVVSARQRHVLLVPLAILGGTGAARIVALLRSRLEHGLLAFGAVIVATAILGIQTAPMREYDHMWRTALRRPVDPHSAAALFDRALAFERVRRWREADAILASLGDYQPMRQAATVSSVSYHRARAALALGRSPNAFLERAVKEAPGDPHVLALRALQMNDRAAARLLDELHDSVTRDRALRLRAR